MEDRQMDRQTKTDCQIYGQIDRNTDCQLDRKTNGQMDKWTDR